MAIKAVSPVSAPHALSQKQFLKKLLPKGVPLQVFHEFLKQESIPRSVDFKTVLIQALKDGDSIEEIIEEAIRTSSDVDKIKKISCKALIQKALLEHSHLPLMSTTAKKAGVDREQKKIVIEAIDDLEKMEIGKQDACYLNRIKSELETILQIPKERHNLQPLETLKICIRAEVALDACESNKAIYLRASDERLPRSVVINPEKQSFIILSKKHGKLHAEGGFKKVSDAVKVTLDGCSTEPAKRMARLVNKTGRKIAKSEIDYEKRYGDIDTLVKYKAKYDHHASKTTLIQEAYDHDLYIFTSYTPENIRKKLEFGDLLEVLSQLGNKLQKMHHEGRVHRDLKAKNVLFRRDENGQIEIKICDFGHTDRPQDEPVMLQKMKNHATVRYTGPEVFDFIAAKVNPFMQQKAIDMYGLGSIIYEFLFIKPTPWAHDVWVAIKKNNKNHEASKKIAITLQKNATLSLLEESRREPDHIRSKLIEICAKLLEPDYKKRMNIDAFQKAITSLQSLYMAYTATEP